MAERQWRRPLVSTLLFLSLSRVVVVVVYFFFSSFLLLISYGYLLVLSLRVVVVVVTVVAHNSLLYFFFLLSPLTSRPHASHLPLRVCRDAAAFLVKPPYSRRHHHM